MSIMPPSGGGHIPPSPCIDVEAMEEEEAQEIAATAAPRTPKRHQEHGDGDVATLAKTARQEDKETINRDLLQFMRQIQTSQETATRIVHNRLDTAP